MPSIPTIERKAARELKEECQQILAKFPTTSDEDQRILGNMLNRFTKRTKKKLKTDSFSIYSYSLKWICYGAWITIFVDSAFPLKKNSLTLPFHRIVENQAGFCAFSCRKAFASNDERENPWKSIHLFLWKHGCTNMPQVFSMEPQSQDMLSYQECGDFGY